MAAAAARGPPADVPEALLLALPHLDLRGLLRVEQVCRALQAAVRDDSSLWCALTLRGGSRGAPQIDDKRLATLVARSRGSSQSLLLWRCFSITSQGLVAALKDCPRLEKLHVVDCRTAMSACDILLLAESLAHSAEHLGLRPSLRQLRLKGSLAKQCSGTDLLELRKYMAPDAGRASPPPLFRARTTCFWDLDIRPSDGYFPMRHNGLRDLKEHDVSGRAIDMGVCAGCRELHDTYQCSPATCTNPRKHSQGDQPSPPLWCWSCVPRCEFCYVCKELSSMKADTFDLQPTWRVEMGDRDGTMCQICKVCEPCWKRLPRCIYCNQASCPYDLEQWARKFHNGTSFLCYDCYDEETLDGMCWASDTDNEDITFPKDYTG
eukprot:SM000036S13357  [mRNA]  locus=s36:850311:851928:+ [translate_table: standard]